jgi:hypothetical protein
VTLAEKLTTEEQESYARMQGKAERRIDELNQAKEYP